MSKITREEAIQCIKHELLINVNRKDLTGQAIGEALDMAIEALTYQNLSKPNNTCEVGLISRADAIDAIQNAYCKPCKERGDDHNEVRCRVCEYDNAIIQIDALPSADAEAVDCTDFIQWLTETVMDDDMWELNAVAYGEVIARKLTKLGVLEVKDDVYVYKPSDKPKTTCVARIEIDTEEVVRRIKEECDIIHHRII